MLPSAKDIYNRIVVLKYVVYHSLRTPLPYIPEVTKNWAKDEIQEFDNEMRNSAKLVIDFLKKIKLWKYHVSHWEKNFLQSFGTKIDSYDHLVGMWRMESAGMLMWSINLITEWPEIDIEISPEILKNIEDKKLNIFSKTPKLRDWAEVSSKRNLMELWHWRVRTRQLIEKGEPFIEDEHIKKAGYRSFDDIVRLAAKTAKVNGDINEIIDDDFVFKGKAFRDLNEDEYNNATSIIMERHYGLNWVCGYAPMNLWDETLTDT
ncbi:MAG: DUF4272 domain-containing protein [Ignavibacteriae bacterium]|nr:DUF4272 domain-containing protein [Ignavibacteriota bacterium]